jgi:hypothetical protein
MKIILKTELPSQDLVPSVNQHTHSLRVKQKKSIPNQQIYPPPPPPQPCFFGSRRLTFLDPNQDHQQLPCDSAHHCLMNTEQLLVPCQVQGSGCVRLAVNLAELQACLHGGGGGRRNMLAD